MDSRANRLPLWTLLCDELREHLGPRTSRVAYFEDRLANSSSAAERVYLHHKLAHLQSGRDTSAAISHLERASELSPEEPWYLIELAWQLEQAGDVANAMERFHQAQRLILTITPTRTGWSDRIRAELNRLEKRLRPG